MWNEESPRSCGQPGRTLGSGLLARIGGFDDDTDRFLVEAFESTFTLQVFQMAAEGAVAHELLALAFLNQTGAPEAIGPFAPDRPAFAFGEGLFQKRQIGKRLHGPDAFGGELLAQTVVIETALEVMQAGVEKTFAVQPNPKSYRAQARRRRQHLARKIDLGL